MRATIKSPSPVIVGGRLVSLGIVRPDAVKIIGLAELATRNGIGLTGSGPLRRATGVKVPVTVGPEGCSCCTWRSGDFCQHAALYLLETERERIEAAALRIRRRRLAAKVERLKRERDYDRAPKAAFQFTSPTCSRADR